MMAIRYGLGALRGIGLHTAQAIEAERQRGGAYTSVLDFVWRTQIDRKCLIVLIKAGALDCLEPNRAQLHENVEIILAARNRKRANEDAGTLDLFDWQASDGR